MTAPWEVIRDRLIADGSMTHRGNTRSARARTCRRCHQPTLEGLDANQAAMEVIVEPWPLTRLGEFAALTQGRYTVGLHHRGRPELDYRDHWRIRRVVAGVDVDVFAEHRCGDFSLRAFAAEPLPRATAPVATTPHQRPPF